MGHFHFREEASCLAWFSGRQAQRGMGWKEQTLAHEQGWGLPWPLTATSRAPALALL